MASEHPLPRTGFARLDEAPLSRKSAPRSFVGLTTLQDPTLGSLASGPSSHPFLALGDSFHRHEPFEEIDRARRVDSFAYRAPQKYVELITKHGYYLDGETAGPIEYLQQRLYLMGMMTGKGIDLLVDNIVDDFVTYSNCFLIKKRGRLKEPIPGIPEKGALDLQYPVLGYFRASPKRMRPVWNIENNKITSWELSLANGKVKNYPLSSILHFAHDVEAGEPIWGFPSITPALEDIRAYRQVEEYMLRLLYKHLNPLMHHEVPDLSGTGSGRQEDVDAAYASHAVIAPDGFIITPPNHKINVIGAESRALRAEGYMGIMKNRIYSGLAVNDVVMGDGSDTTAGSADAQTVSMHNTAKFYQRQLSCYLTEQILCELLLEGGFNPLDKRDRVNWVWNNIEIEAQIKWENHVMSLATSNLISMDEARRKLGLKPLTPEEEFRTYAHLVKIPEIEARALALARAAEKSGAIDQIKGKDNPSNQHGDRGAPKIRPR